MKHPEKFPQGVPCWADLMTSDVPAAREAYGALLGWTYVDGTEESGFYSMALVDGVSVAGVGALPPDAPQPPAWTVYLAVDSCDDTLAAVREAGGTVLMGPIDVRVPAYMGRMAVIADPAGAVVGLWQSVEHTGFGAVQQDGTVVWNECMSRDAARSREFLATVFGYEFQQIGDGEQFDYTVGIVAGEEQIGVMAMGSSYPAEVPSYWMPTFQVADADATAATLTAAGGQLMMGPDDSPYGRIVVGADPQGAAVGFIQPTPRQG